MARVVFLLYIFLMCISTSFAVLQVQIQQNVNKNLEKPVDPNNDVKRKEEPKGNDIAAIKINIPKTGDKKTNNISTASNITPSKIGSNSSVIKTKTSTEVESGAVMRGIFVFVGIALLFIMYIGFKTYRKSHKKNVLIKKYGVRTRRSDVELEPLPLEEDDEDETVFDVGNINNR